MEDNCLFCKIVKGEIPCYKVFENDDVLAFLDIFPANLGHTLVIPKKHCESIFEVDSEIMAEIGKASKNVAENLKNKLGAKGVSVFQSNGAVSGQEIMHYHMHLVPRGDDNENLTRINIQRIMNLKEEFPNVSSQMAPEVAKQVLDKLNS